jgi:short-subunit dehydrogenase
MSESTSDRDDFLHRYGSWALIAGASEGVGAALADQLAERGLNVFLLARNSAVLEKVAAAIRDRHGVQARTLGADLTAPDIEARVAEATEGLDIGLLIYNAGAANRIVTFLEMDLDYSLSQIKLACMGPVILVKHFAPAMVERGRGGIVLVGSLACLAGSATIAVYSAVKAFDHNFAEALWAELGPQGVDVCSAPLGRTWTEASERLGAPLDPNIDMPSSDAAREIIENIGNGPVFVVGENNRLAAAHVWNVDRRGLVEMLSAASWHFANSLNEGG